MHRVATLALVVALIGCGDSVGNSGSTVGGPCTASNQCDSLCKMGGDFPQGMCTLACSTDMDCPNGTFCIDTQGGICLLGCQLPSDCRGGYSCDGKANKGHAGDSLVCTN